MTLSANDNLQSQQSPATIIESPVNQPEIETSVTDELLTPVGRHHYSGSDSPT